MGFVIKKMINNQISMLNVHVSHLTTFIHLSK